MAYAARLTGVLHEAIAVGMPCHIAAAQSDAIACGAGMSSGLVVGISSPNSKWRVIMGDWIKEEKKRKRDDGKWEIVIKVCNPTDKDIESILVTEHPWGGADGKKMGDQPQPKFISLKAKECKEVVFGPYDAEPKTGYTDVYEKVGVKLEWRDGTVTELKVAAVPVPEGGRTTVGIVRSIPHPWRAALTYQQPLGFTIRSITGLPAGWHLAFSRPAVGESIMLAPEVKHQPLYLELQTSSPVPEGIRFAVDVEIGIDGFPADQFHTVHVGALLARDTMPPTVSATATVIDQTHAEIHVSASDPASGIERPSVRFSTDGVEWCTRLLTPLNEVYDGPLAISGTYRGTIPAVNGVPVAHVVTVADGVGNVREIAAGGAMPDDQVFTNPAAPRGGISLEVADQAFRTYIPR